MLSKWLVCPFTVVVVLLLARLPAFAAENRILPDRVDVEAQEGFLRLHADVLDSHGAPIGHLTASDFEISANGKPLALQSLEVQTSEQAQEPVAVLILLNASRGYQPQGEGEEHGAFQQAKEGAAQFIQRLKGNDMVAVVAYRESVPQEVVYSFAADHAQAHDAVLHFTVPSADAGALGGAAIGSRERSLLPEFQSAVKKALEFFNENLTTNRKLATAKRRILVILSDAKDRETRKDRLQPKLKKLVEERIEESGIRIFAIGFSPDDEQYLSLLQDVANVSGGAYTYLPNREGLAQIPAVFDAFAQRIKKQYVIRAKWAALPDWGDPIKGKEEASYHIGLKVKLKDGAEVAATFDDVHLPLPGIDWALHLKRVGLGLVALLLLAAVALLVVRDVRRRRDAKQRQKLPDGPVRGRLRVVAGPQTGAAFLLVDDVTTLGSALGNTIVLADKSVSRRHATLKIDQMRFEISDVNATNGVLVNGQRVARAFLRDGDRLQIGETELQFLLK